MRISRRTVLLAPALARHMAAAERDVVKDQMRLRPADPLPRGAGHVVLAVPGSPETEKAYHEPGGGFSPAPGSFGVSIWLDGGTTGDNIPLAEIRQRLAFGLDAPVPGIRTETPQYTAEWTSGGAGVWKLALTVERGSPVVAIRSVGPAGGPIRALDWDGMRLTVNGRWQVTSDALRVYLGEEGDASWRTARPAAAHWKGESGWGYARFEWPAGTCRLSIADSRQPAANPLAGADPRYMADVNVPDERFLASFHAQVAHLMMGLVRNETRPGDPLNYPLAWLRDGAYTVAALARAGQVKVARQLAEYFAEHDFFGGFGAEADGPGLALWAIGEASAAANDPAWDRRAWPHARRKAELILEMLAATGAVGKPFDGPIVPRHRDNKDLQLVAEAARDGLIVGRMDHHWPLLYVNAVSYRGLVEAANLATRVDAAGDAARWRDRAAALRQAWQRALAGPEARNERTWICGLWPTWVADGVREPYRAGLASATAQQFAKPPLWTYFDVAKAHQWLYLGEPAKAWSVMEWFWEHQASPGLFTWWEGSGEENTFHRWEDVRGWVNPAHVTPHYWTAAEMLLLQLDMLAYEDPAGLVIGAGVPRAWLEKPVSFRAPGIEWQWDGRRVRVAARRRDMKARLGPGFPAGTEVVYGTP